MAIRVNDCQKINTDGKFFYPDYLLIRYVLNRRNLCRGLLELSVTRPVGYVNY